MGRRKLEEKPFDEQEFFRDYSLMEATRLGDIREIEGITFDLKTGLDPEKWAALSPLGFYGRAAFEAPGIIFPWTPEYFSDFYRRRGPTIDAPAGSYVTIAHIADSSVTWPLDEFDEHAEAGRKAAYVSVLLPDGQSEIAQQPLVFVRRDAAASLISARDYLGAFQAMISRLGAMLGIDDVEKLADGPLDNWPSFPPTIPRAYLMALFALREREADFDGHAMAAFGYLMARAEAETSLLASARRGREAIAHAKRASLAKAEKNKAALQPILLRAAALCEADPNLTLTRCAKQIAAEFDRDQRWIAKKIIDLFEKRPNGREYRPRRSPPI